VLQPSYFQLCIPSYYIFCILDMKGSIYISHIITIVDFTLTPQYHHSTLFNSILFYFMICSVLYQGSAYYDNESDSVHLALDFAGMYCTC